MAWTEVTRRRYQRSGGRYASDAGDAEWALLAPLMPAPKRIGRPRTIDLRDVFDAILHIATTGRRPGDDRLPGADATGRHSPGLGWCGAPSTAGATTVCWKS